MLGETYEIDENLFSIWEKFVLCKENLDCAPFNNTVRYQMFCANNSRINQLPPSHDSLQICIAISIAQITKRQSKTLFRNSESCRSWTEICF